MLARQLMLWCTTSPLSRKRRGEFNKEPLLLENSAVFVTQLWTNLCQIHSLKYRRWPFGSFVATKQASRACETQDDARERKIFFVSCIYIYGSSFKFTYVLTWIKRENRIPTLSQLSRDLECFVLCDSTYFTRFGVQATCTLPQLKSG